MFLEQKRILFQYVDKDDEDIDKQNLKSKDYGKK